MVLALKTVWDRSAAKNRAQLDIFLLLVTSLKKPFNNRPFDNLKRCCHFSELLCTGGVAQDFGIVSQMRLYLS